MTPSSPELEAATELEAEFRQGIMLCIAYDGHGYAGLVIQANAHTVGGELERAIRMMDPTASPIRVTSRTDGGVHAQMQYVCFDTSTQINCRGWVRGLSSNLPPSIAVLSASKVRPRLHPAKLASQKLYRYQILIGTIRNPIRFDGEIEDIANL